MHDPSAVTTFLFTDIEGSTRLWEREPERMNDALARHDAIARASVTEHHGTVVKTTGDGIHAVFADPLEALLATVRLQLALAEPDATGGIALRVRCGLHAGVETRRDNDYFGNAVNRAARIMSAAHGGQVLLSQTVAALVRDRLPEDVSLRDLGAVRLRDLTHPERLHQLVHPRLREQFPALRSLESTPNNLPQQLTSFIGREHELAEAKNLLREVRLLTLLGIGGLGKSRLSLQVAADVLDDYPDGVWFVELAPLTDARLVPQTIASVLGVKEEPGHTVAESLVKFIRDRHLLVVLDNCEHLAQASAELVKQLLEAGPQLKVLASSREHLNIRGERTYPLAPLAVPLPQQKVTRDTVTQFASVRLFADRAAAARPDFEITDENIAAVVEICHRLDGIPLALELAAARTRAMSVEKIAARLTDRFRLLGGGDRTALPRQQTLRALIDWSYDLLADGEKVLFRRLAVFAGGFTLEAAEQVGGGGDPDEGDVLDLLVRLVEKSLVSMDAAGDRYRMLETVRQYAQSRLDETDEADRVRNRHLASCLALAEKAGPKLNGPGQGAWLARLDVERENFIAAHAWCDRAEGGGELGLRLVRSIRFYLFNRGLLGLGYQGIVEALARTGAQQRNLARCRVLSDAGQFATRMGRHAEALGHLEESLAIAREIGDRSRVAVALQPLGMTHFALGDFAAARRHLDEALGLARELGNKREIAAALSVLAQLHRAEGSLDAAQPLCEQVLTLARELGDRESTAVALLNLAMVAILRQSVDVAAQMLVEAHAIVVEIGSKATGQSVLEAAAGLATSRGRWDLAARFVGAAETQARQSGARRDPADEAFLAQQVAQVRAALGASSYSSTEASGRALSYDEALMETRTWLLDCA